MKRKETKMKKNVMTSLIFAIALALVVLSIAISSGASTAFIPVMVILMAAYCIGQYRYGVNFR